MKQRVRQVEYTQSGLVRLYESQHNKTNKMAHAPSDDTDQPGHLKKHLDLGYPFRAQQRL